MAFKYIARGFRIVSGSVEKSVLKLAGNRAFVGVEALHALGQLNRSSQSPRRPDSSH